MSYTLTCHGCHTVATVNRITAGLRCTCGSTDLDLYDPEPTFLEAMGAAHGPGTGWGQPHPDELKGWSQYPGPMPGLNPFGTPAGPMRCSNCRGSGWSLREKCRACGGTGVRTPPTAVSPEPMVARHPGQTKIPMVGRRKKQAARPPKDPNAPPTVQQVLQKTVPGFGERGMKSPADPNASPYESDGRYPGADSHSPHMQNWKPGPYSDEDLRNAKPYPMHDAPCPNCGASPTHLLKDSKDDAWWHCPTCGPLANIDKHPEVDPYANHGEDFAPEKGFQARAAKGSVKKTGRLLAMIATVGPANPGLSTREVVGLARQTLIRYGE
jgi:hypothetical protein